MTIWANDVAVHARAPGKINLFMRVGALEPDGYHDVATAYQAVSLYEDVLAWHDDEFSVAFGGSIDTSGLPTDASNLAIRAAKLLARHAGVPGGVRLEIDKNVPIAGGMGGGSADAAATLIACDALWGTALPKEELLMLAASLGADVPFALSGGTAIGTGRGDRLSPALATGSFHWVLAVAEFGLSTPGGVPRARSAARGGTGPHVASACRRPAARRRRRGAARAARRRHRAASRTPCTTTCSPRRSRSRRGSRASSNSASPTAPSPGSSRARAPRSRSSSTTPTRRSSCRLRSPRRGSPRCTCTAPCTAPACMHP